MKLKFTKIEVEILAHRLGVPDALADCLEESHEREQVMFTAGVLQQQLKRGDVLDTDDLEPVAVAILKDCCDGSTFFADIEDAVASKEITRGTALNWQKAAGSLERKLKAAGIEVSIPNY